MSHRSTAQLIQSTRARQSKTKSKSPARTATFFDLLKQDHEKIRDLFEQIGESDEMEIEEIGDVFSQITVELEMHMEEEESYFYPALEEPEDTHEKALEAYEEHDVSKFLLNELKSMAQDDERWKAKMKVLRDVFEHHIEGEESGVFKMARKALDREQIKEITDNIEQQRGRTHVQA